MRIRERIQNVYRSFASNDALNAMQFSSVWRAVTGENNNLFNEMSYFNKMDVGGKGYITEQVFVDGWRHISQTAGMSILRRFSDASDTTPIQRRSRTDNTESAGVPASPNELNEFASEIRVLFNAFAKDGESGMRFVNPASFGKIWRKITGEKGNLFNEMKYFHQMDIGSKGYLTEDEFVDGWLKFDHSSQGEILRRFSSESTQGGTASVNLKEEQHSR